MLEALELDPLQIAFNVSKDSTAQTQLLPHCVPQEHIVQYSRLLLHLLLQLDNFRYQVTLLQYPVNLAHSNQHQDRAHV